MDANYELVIGNKNYSSWSLRPWLVLKMAGIPFGETQVFLKQPDTAAEIARHSPAGKVPVLKHGNLTVWDSLAIIEYLADAHPDKDIWPEDRNTRAIARAVSAEMHSGFSALRREFAMDFVNKRSFPAASEAAQGDITRIVALWIECRRCFGSDGDRGFLFGRRFSAADAMFAPVVSRFVSYTIDLPAFGDDGVAARYCDMMMDLPAMREWGEGARAEWNDGVRIEI
ncbi:MAG: glutathione S-transferase family protein [Alphaproteobacteria bacterium]